MRLIATRSMTYNTRRLMPDDRFEANDRDAKILIGIKKARAADRVVGAVPRPESALIEKASRPADGDLADLRRQYQERFNKRPFNGWNADALKAKLADGPNGAEAQD